VMDYDACQCAFSPCQIGIIQMNFFNDHTIQRNMCRPDWCSYHPDSTVTIHQGENVEWFAGHELQGDLLIEAGGSLTLHCILGMPEGARIIVLPEGSLTLDGGVITNRCQGKWKGIQVGHFQHLTGQVTLLHGARLEDMANTLDEKSP